MELATAPIGASRMASLARQGAGITSRPAAIYWRRRALAVVVLVVLAFALTVLAGRIGAEAQLDDPVAGHVVVEPGQTLWDVARATAPAGTDVRAHLAEISALNGLSGAAVPAWTVVLVPAY